MKRRIRKANTTLHRTSSSDPNRLYRSVRASAIPGGSEEILLDFTMRQVMSKALSKGRKSKSKL